MSFAFGPFELDIETRQLLRGGGEVHLSPKALQLLQALVDRRPNAVAKAELQNVLWPETYVSESSLPGLIKELRSALDDDPRAPRYVRTVHGYGYAFCGDSARTAGAPTARLSWHQGEGLLFAGRNVIGRDRGASVRINDSTVSRQHAAIDIAGETITLVDLDSKNGTFLGGVAVTGVAVPLRDGDELRVGSIAVWFHRAADQSTATFHSA